MESCIAVSPKLFALLPSHTVIVHLPLTNEAAAEARANLRFDAKPSAADVPMGWFKEAMDAKDPLERLRSALLAHEIDPGNDPWSRLARSLRPTS